MYPWPNRLRVTLPLLDPANASLSEGRSSGVLLQAQLLHQQGRAVVDVLEAGVRVEAQHNNRQGHQQTLQDQQRVAPANALHAPRELVLGDLVGTVDVMRPYLC